MRTQHGNGKSLETLIIKRNRRTKPTVLFFVAYDGRDLFSLWLFWDDWNRQTQINESRSIIVFFIQIFYLLSWWRVTTCFSLFAISFIRHKVSVLFFYWISLNKFGAYSVTTYSVVKSQDWWILRLDWILWLPVCYTWLGRPTNRKNMTRSFVNQLEN